MSEFDDVEDYSSNVEDYSDNGLSQPNIAAGNHDQLPSVEEVKMTMGGGAGRSMNKKLLYIGLAVLTVGVLFVIMGGGGKNKLGSLNRQEALDSIENEGIGGVDFDDKDSYQYKAYAHLLPDDKVTHYSFEKFQQRYGMYCLYFATGHTFWTEDRGWRRMKTDECTWFGVKCDDDGMVTRIELRNNGLQGTLIPPELQYVTKLKVLNLRANDLAGAVPSAVCDLQAANVGEFKVDCSAVTCTCCDECD